ncbi:unnamed protein product [Nesidiocoris tenuis]|uniref:Uncharacterized protein n=1 Tax=Nesidiocoris tenuis TaxID=355587 RepID=A0A6H5GQ77_9HEMI|nr:unnamed protein product [Nesidiocoris tenuis]
MTPHRGGRVPHRRLCGHDSHDSGRLRAAPLIERHSANQTRSAAWIRPPTAQIGIRLLNLSERP